MNENRYVGRPLSEAMVLIAKLEDRIVELENKKTPVKKTVKKD